MEFEFHETSCISTSKHGLHGQELISCCGQDQSETALIKGMTRICMRLRGWLSGHSNQIAVYSSNTQEGLLEMVESKTNDPPAICLFSRNCSHICVLCHRCTLCLFAATAALAAFLKMMLVASRSRSMPLILTCSASSTLLHSNAAA